MLDCKEFEEHFEFDQQPLEEFIGLVIAGG